MSPNFGLAFLALLLLSIMSSLGSSIETYAGLVSPIPEVRDRTKSELLLSDSEELCRDIKQLISSEKSPANVLEAALILLRDKSDSLPARLLGAASVAPSPRVRAAILRVSKLNFRNAGDMQVVVSMLADTNIIVRLSAASLLKNQKLHAQEVMTIGVQSLSSDEPEWLGDPPRPAVILGKQLLASMKNRKAVLAFLRNQSTDTRRVQYHLRDLIAYLSNKSPRMIYNHIGDPTDDEAKLLSSP